MAKEILIPVIVDVQMQDKIKEEISGGPATISNKIKKAITKSLSLLSLDEVSLKECIKSSVEIVNSLKETTSMEGGLKPDTLSIQLGVTSSGAVGFMGSNLEIKLAAVIQVGFKIQ